LTSNDISEWFVIGVDDTSDNSEEIDVNTADFMRRLSLELTNTSWGLVEGTTRHTLFSSPKISNDGSNISYAIKLHTARSILDLEDFLVDMLRANSAKGSDPGLAILSRHSDMPHVLAFGRRTQTEIMRLDWAQTFSTESNVTLRAVGAKRNGSVGALAAAGLRAGGDVQARFIEIPGLTELSGKISAGQIRELSQLQRLLDVDNEQIDRDDIIDLGDGMPTLKPHLEFGEPLVRFRQHDDDRRLWLPESIFLR
jgi:hypothetical protein